MIELWHSALSPCAQKVRIVLAEKNLEWTGHVLNLAEKENLRPDYLKLNPKGLVPTLRDGGTVVTDSSIINEYLDDRYSAPSLKPADPIARARMRTWAKLVDDKVHPAFGELGWPIMVRPAWLRKTEAEQKKLLAVVKDPKRRDRQTRLLAMGVRSVETRETMKVLDATMVEMEEALGDGRPWLTGESFSLADASLIPYVSALTHFGMTAFFAQRLPKVAAWLARCKARPSFERAIRAPVPAERWQELDKQGKEAWKILEPELAS